MSTEIRTEHEAPNGIEPEIMDAEPELKIVDKRHGAIVKREPTAIERQETTDSNALITQAMQIEGLTLAERLMLIDKVEAITVARQQAAAERAFYEALSAFQRECPVIEKKRPVYQKNSNVVRYYYAPLGDIVKAVGPLLGEHGLSFDFSDAIVTPFEEGKGGPFMDLTLNVHHQEGHSRAFPYRVVIEDNEFMSATQHGGEANSYARRYAFTNGFGILTADQDFDGNQPEQLTPNRIREAKAPRQPVSQPKSTPTAQRAAATQGSGERQDLEPAGEGEAIDSATVKGLTAAMSKATLGNPDFVKRFPQLAGLECVKKTDSRVVMSWIADPTRNYMAYSELPYNGNYPPGVTDNDPYFTDESDDDNEGCAPIPCSKCGEMTTFDPIYQDLCYRCCRASNE